jgi:hypothetical protein
MLPMMIPFLTIIVFAEGEREQRYHVSDSVDFQEYSKSVVGKPTVIAIKSFGFYEKIIGETDFEFEINGEYHRVHSTESIKILNDETSDSLQVEFKFKDGSVKRTM